MNIMIAPVITFVVFVLIIKCVYSFNRQRDEYLDWKKRMGLDDE